MKTFFSFVAILLIIACSKKSDSQENDMKKILDSALSKKISSSHFNYYMSEGDKVDTVFQEKYYNWLISKLQIPVPEKINFFKFRDRQQMKNILGFEINGFADPGTNNIYAVWPTDNHELVHSIINKYVGFPKSLFNEGIAVAHQVDLKDSVFVPSEILGDINIISKYYSKNGKIQELDTLLSLPTLREIDELISYPVAGSFTSYLIEEYSIEKLIQFIGVSLYDDELSKVKDNFNNIYKISLKEAWANWIKYLKGYKKEIDCDRYYQDWYKRFN